MNREINWEQQGLFVRGIEVDWGKISRGSYLREIESIRNLQSLEFRKQITFFVGENGSGKSTLLESMAIGYGFNPEGGTKNYCFSTFDSHSELCDALRIVKGYQKPQWGYFLRAESFYNVATKEDEYEKGYGGVPQYYHYQSHGESFLALLQNNLKSKSIYFFDEPEAALSPQRQLTLLCDIIRCARQGSQFFIATHSPILLGMPGCEILSFDGGEISPCAYENTEHYLITEMFINHKDELLRRLLEEESLQD